MAKYGNGKLKYWYVTVFKNYSTVFNQQCVDVGEANRLFAEKKEEYKGFGSEYYVVKEQY